MDLEIEKDYSLTEFTALLTTKFLSKNDHSRSFFKHSTVTLSDSDGKEMRTFQNKHGEFCNFREYAADYWWKSKKISISLVTTPNVLQIQEEKDCEMLFAPSENRHLFSTKNQMTQQFWQEQTLKDESEEKQDHSE